MINERIEETKPRNSTSDSSEKAVNNPEDMKKKRMDLFERTLLNDPVVLNNLGALFRKGDRFIRNERLAFEFFQIAAECGYPSALINLGQCYENGIWITEDPAEAFLYYELAVVNDTDGKHTGGVAQYNLGRCYEYGEAVIKNLNKAREYYRRAVKLGYKEAEDELGYIGMDVIEKQKYIGLYEVKNVEIDKKSEERKPKIRIFNSSAEAVKNPAVMNKRMNLFEQTFGNFPERLNILGTLYAQGKIFTKNERHAFEFYQMAAKGDKYVPALINLGRCYAYGIGVERNLPVAFMYYKSATLRDPNGEYTGGAAHYDLGVCYQVGEVVPQDLNEAFRLYQFADLKGYAPAQNRLGDHYFQGQYGVLEDKQEAFRFYRRAANQGSSEAQLRLGECYLRGQGVPQSVNQALHFFQLAADQENADALVIMGTFFQNGIGVEMDSKKAFDYFKLAADKDKEHAFAQFNLARCYEEGIGIYEDKDEADRLCRLISKNGIFCTGFIPMPTDIKSSAGFSSSTDSKGFSQSASSSSLSSSSISPCDVEKEAVSQVTSHSGSHPVLDVQNRILEGPMKFKLILWGVDYDDKEMVNDNNANTPSSSV